MWILLRRLVGRFFVTPVVHFEDGIGHRQIFYAWFQLVVEYGTAGIEPFVVYPHGQDKMTPFAGWNIFAPGHFLLGPERAVDVGDHEFAGVVDAIGQRQVFVEKIKTLLAFRGCVGCRRRNECGGSKD